MIITKRQHKLSYPRRYTSNCTEENQRKITQPRTMVAPEAPAITPGGYVYQLAVVTWGRKVYKSTIKVEKHDDIISEKLRLTRLYNGKLLSCNLITEEKSTA